MHIDVAMELLEESEALMLEPRDVFDAAFVGIANRANGLFVAAYDSDKCITALMKQNDWDYSEALEWFGYNVASSFTGPGTPVFLDVVVAE